MHGSENIESSSVPMSASFEAHDMELNLWVQVDCVVEVEPEAVVEQEQEQEQEVEVMEILMEGVMVVEMVVEMEDVFDTFQYPV